MDLRSRIRTFWRIIKAFAWRWLVLVPSALLGVFQAWRDEVIPVSEQDEYQILNIIPDWPWEWWGLLTFFLFISFFFEGAYRLIRNLDQQLVPALRVCFAGSGEFSELIYGAVQTTAAGTKVIQVQPVQSKPMMLDCINKSKKLVTGCEASLNSIHFSSDGKDFEPTQFLESLRLAWVHREGNKTSDRFVTSIPSGGRRKLCVLHNLQGNIFLQVDAVPVNNVNMFKNKNGIFRLFLSLCTNNAASLKVVIDLDKRDPENIRAKIVETDEE